MVCCHSNILIQTCKKYNPIVFCFNILFRAVVFLCFRQTLAHTNLLCYNSRKYFLEEISYDFF